MSSSDMIGQQNVLDSGYTGFVIHKIRTDYKGMFHGWNITFHDSSSLFIFFKCPLERNISLPYASSCLVAMKTLHLQIHCDITSIRTSSAGFRTNEALCQLSYEAPYLGPAGGRPGRHTQAHSHRLSTLSLCLESLKNRTPSNLKLHHISKNPS